MRHVMKALQGWLPWVRLLSTEWIPQDFLPQYAKWFDKEYTEEDILLGIVASFLGIVTVSVTFLTIFVLTIVL